MWFYVFFGGEHKAISRLMSSFKPTSSPTSFGHQMSKNPLKTLHRGDSATIYFIRALSFSYISWHFFARLILVLKTNLFQTYCHSSGGRCWRRSVTERALTLTAWLQNCIDWLCKSQKHGAHKWNAAYFLTIFFLNYSLFVRGTGGIWSIHKSTHWEEEIELQGSALRSSILWVM